MVVEAVVAIGAGLAAHSLVLVAFGADSVIELVSSSALLWRLYVERNQASVLGLGIAIASSILMPILAAAKKRIGRQIGSKALEADGSCSMVCAYMSWIVLAGVLATAILGWWWLDSIAALGLVYFVVHGRMEAIEEAR